MLEAAMLIGGLLLFLLLKAADYPKETPNDRVQRRAACGASAATRG